MRFPVALLFTLAMVSTSQAIGPSGVVTTASGAPLSGAILRLDARGLSDTSDASGLWSLGVVGPVGNHSRNMPTKTFVRGNDLILSPTQQDVFGVDLLDLQGRVVFHVSSRRGEKGFRSIPLPAALGRGMYWARLEFGDRTEIIPVMAGMGPSRSRRGALPQDVAGELPTDARLDAARSTSNAPESDILTLSWRGKMRGLLKLPRLDTSGIRFALDSSLTAYRKPGISYDSFVDARDGQTYRSLLAYDQIWMAENLNYAPDSSWWYRGVPDSGARYGRLYTWAAATGLPDSCNNAACGSLLDALEPGVCPTGWRLPGPGDWNALFQFLNDGDGSSIRSQSSWRGGTGSDTLGFGSTPSGYRTGSGTYLDAGTSTAWWTVSESDAGFGMSQFLGATSRSQKATHKRIGNPIRCVRSAPLDSSLETLDVSNNILNPSFSPSILTYTTDSFPSSTRSFRIVATPKSPEALVTCNGVACGETYLDQPSTIKVQVVHKSRSLSYTVTVPRKRGATDFVDPRDGKVYPIAVVGSQTWMARNLDHKPEGADSGWWYKNSPDYGRSYGRLYLWHTAMNLADSCDTVSCASLLSPRHQGICPTGWHLPSDPEYLALIAGANGIDISHLSTIPDAFTLAREKLAATSGWPRSFGTDTFGFDLRPSGSGNGNQENISFANTGVFAAFWMPSEASDGRDGIFWGTHFTADTSIFVANTTKHAFRSIRCLKD